MSKHEFLYDDEIITSTCENSGDSLRVTVGEREFLFNRVAENLYSTTLNGKACVVGAVVDKGTYYIDIDSVLVELKDPDEAGVAGGAGGLEGEKDKIFAPMPGKIVKLHVAVGQEVEDKQAMVIVEAMKMEHQVLCKAKGKVKAVNFAEGDQVDTESPIIELEIEE